jgi:ZIP family zinc transporter
MKDYLYAVIGISLIFICTTIGALFVFFFKNKEISPRLNKIFIGFAAGVMLCASFTSLIVPALNSEVTYMPSWSIVAISLVLGAGFLWLIDKLVPHFHVNENKDEGLPSRGLFKQVKCF